MSSASQAAPQEKRSNPTRSQIAEVTTPGLSKVSFPVGKKTIPIKILPYAHERKFIASLSGIEKLLMDLFGQGEKKEETKAAVPDGAAPAPPQKESLMDVIKSRGLTKTILEGADVIFDALACIGQIYDEEITLDYVKENVHLSLAWKIVIAQIEKNELGDLVSSFFYKGATLLPKVQAFTQEFPEN